MDFTACAKRVDELLGHIRAGYLGQLVNFRELVPPGAVLAERTAQALTLRLEEAALDEAKLLDAHLWLALACRFLVESCPPDDSTIYNLLKILRLDGETLEELTPVYFDNDESWAFSHPPGFLEAGLENVAWEMMDDEAKVELEKSLETMKLMVKG